MFGEKEKKNFIALFYECYSTTSWLGNHWEV